MTKYLDKTFSVAVGSDDYRNNWDAVFGKKTEQRRPAVGDIVEGLCPSGDWVTSEVCFAFEGNPEFAQRCDGGTLHHRYEDEGVTWRWPE